MKIYIQINKAMTNIFGLRTHPRKTTHTKYCGLKIWIWLSLWVKNMNLIIVGINQYGTGSPLDVNRNIYASPAYKVLWFKNMNLIIIVG